MSADRHRLTIGHRLTVLCREGHKVGIVYSGFGAPPKVLPSWLPGNVLHLDEGDRLTYLCVKCRNSGLRHGGSGAVRWERVLQVLGAMYGAGRSALRVRLYAAELTAAVQMLTPSGYDPDHWRRRMRDAALAGGTEWSPRQLREAERQAERGTCGVDGNDNDARNVDSA